MRTELRLVGADLSIGFIAAIMMIITASGAWPVVMALLSQHTMSLGLLVFANHFFAFLLGH